LFRSTRAVAVLFAYGRSVVREQAGTEQAFRIMRMAGRTFEELRDDGVRPRLKISSSIKIPSRLCWITEP
jgi:hypothetical protein